MRALLLLDLDNLTTELATHMTTILVSRTDTLCLPNLEIFLNALHLPLFSKIPAWVFLLTAVLIFSAGGGVYGKLVQIGEEYQRQEHLNSNPISFCNVLTAGNIVAALISMIIYRKQLTLENMSELSACTWFSLTVIAVFYTALG